MNNKPSKYLTMSEISSLNLTPIQIQEQIQMRENLLANLFGNLYPSIVEGEIEKLMDLKQERQLNLF